MQLALYCFELVLTRRPFYVNMCPSGLMAFRLPWLLDTHSRFYNSPPMLWRWQFWRLRALEVTVLKFLIPQTSISSQKLRDNRVQLPNSSKNRTIQPSDATWIQLFCEWLESFVTSRPETGQLTTETHCNSPQLAGCLRRLQSPVAGSCR